MRDARRTGQQAPDLLFEHAVGVGDPLMRVHELEPGFDQERLDEAADFGGVLEHAPGIGAVALALIAELVERGEEFDVVLGIDAILHGHQDRPLVVLDFSGELRRAPVHGGCEVEPFAGLKLPEPGQGNGDDRAGRRRIMGDRQALHPGDLAPSGAADGRRAEDDGEEDRKAAAAHPIGQGYLRRDIEGCQHHGPGCARDDAGVDRGERFVREAEENERERGGERAQRDDRIGPELAPQPVEPERPDDGPEADRAQEDAVKSRPAFGHLARCDERQQSPIGAGEGKERERAREGRAEIAVVRGVADAGANGAGEALGGQALRALARRPPPEQGGDDPEIADAEQPEGHSYAERGDDHAAERRPYRAAEVEPDAVGRDRAVEVAPRHQQRRGREPGRRAQRAADAEQESRHQQGGGSREVERDEAREDRRHDDDDELDDDEQPAGVDDVGERAGRQSEQEQRQAHRHLNERDRERVGIEAGDQPAGRRVEHRGADVRNDAGGPDDGEGRMAERAPARSLGRSRLRSGIRLDAQYAPREATRTAANLLPPEGRFVLYLTAKVSLFLHTKS